MYNYTIQPPEFENGFTWTEFYSWRQRSVLQLRVITLLRDPPYLYPGERDFLQDMHKWLEKREETEKQLSWIEKIERRKS